MDSVIGVRSAFSAVGGLAGVGSNTPASSNQHDRVLSMGDVNGLTGGTAPARETGFPSLEPKPFIQPKRVLCLTAFFAIIWFGVFIINTASDLLIRVGSDEKMFSQLKMMYANVTNNANVGKSE